MNYNKHLLDGIVLFCTIVEQDGISAAANQLGHTPSHVSKQLAGLEKRLGCKLINRTTRKLGLTETGRIYYENARSVIADTKIIEDRLQVLGDRPYGELKISVPIIFAQGCFSSWVPEFLTLYPDVNLDVVVTDRRIDLVSENFDLAVRMGHLANSEMMTRELFQSSLPLLASPRYLKKYGVPKHPSDLAKHQLISFSNSESTNDWCFPNNNGATINVASEIRIKCNEADLERTLVLAGKGIARLPEFAYLNELKSGKLIRILAEYEDRSVGLHLLYPDREYLPPKTRAMLDFLISKTKQYFKS